MTTMDLDISLRILLQDIGLANYEAKLREHGYDSAQVLLNMRREDFRQLQVSTQMLPGHLLRLQQEITHRNEIAQGPNALEVGQMTTLLRDPTRTVVCGPGPTITPEVGPPVESGPVPTIPLSAAEKKIRCMLEAQHCDWKTAKLATLQWSTIQGCRAQQDPKKCGLRSRVYRCSSLLSKRKRQDEDDEQIPCPHVLYWSRKKKNGNNWALDQSRSVLAHSPWCTSTQNVSHFELVNDTEFVKHVKNERKSTGGACVKNAVGRMGRMDGSVKEHTARRAQNSTKRWNDKDYDNDWNKLKGWVRAYMEKNRQSRAEVKVDSENRLGPN